MQQWLLIATAVLLLEKMQHTHWILQALGVVMKTVLMMFS